MEQRENHIGMKSKEECILGKRLKRVCNIEHGGEKKCRDRENEPIREKKESLPHYSIHITILWISECVRVGGS